MAGKYRKFRKPIYCPNACRTGYSMPSVVPGSFIEFRTKLLDESIVREFARVIGLATHNWCGEKYDNPRLLVIAAGICFSHGFERHIKIENVTDIYSTGDFTKWFFFGKKMPSPEMAVAMANRGSLSNGYLAKYLDDNGEISLKKWKNRKRSKKTWSDK